MVRVHTEVELADETKMQIKQSAVGQNRKSEGYNRKSEGQNRKSESEEKCRNLKLLTVSITMICFGAFYIGWMLGQLSGVSLECLNETFGSVSTSSPMYGILQGAISFGAIFGGIATPFLMRCFSQRKIILLTNIAILLVLALNQIPDVYVLLVTRLFLGVFAGVLLSIVPIYINDQCPTQILPVYAPFTGMFVIIGLLFSYVLAEIFNQVNASCQVSWRCQFGVIAIFIILETVLIFANVIHESPNCLIRSDRKEEAKQIMSLFIKEQFLEEAFKSKIDEIQFEAAHAANENESVKIRPSIYLLTFGFLVWFHLVGTNAVLIYIGVYISQHSSLGQIYAIVVLLSNFLGALLALWLHSKVGRRPIILVSNVIYLVLNICLTILFIFINDWEAAITMVLVVSSLYTLLFGLSLNSLSFAYISQIMPVHMIPYFHVVFWATGALVLVVTPIVTAASNDNPYIMFIFFSIATLIAFFINWMYFVETKGVTKIEIMRLISAKSQ